MSTIHDRFKKRPKVPGAVSQMEESSIEIQPIENSETLSTELETQKSEFVNPNHLPSKGDIARANATELNHFLENANNAMEMVDDIVLKQYLTKLESLEVIPSPGEDLRGNTILFKINKMVYEKDEFVTDKFISALSAMTYADCSLILVVDGYEDHTDFYIGIRNDDAKKERRRVADTLEASLKGQFPGIQLKDCSIVGKGENFSSQDILIHRIKQASTVTSFVGVPSFKDEDGTYTNATYVQGIEKLALAMQGRRYTAIILASNLTAETIEEMRVGYENLYTQLSAISTQQLAYSTNESLANAFSRSTGYSDSVSDTHTDGTSHTDGKSTSHTVNESVSQKSGWAKAGSIIGGALAAVGGVALMATGIGAPVGAAIAAVGAGGGLAAAGASGKQKTTGTSDTSVTNESDTTNHSDTHGETHTETFTETSGKTATIGSGKNFTLTLHNKHVEELQKRIDRQLERIALSESTGLWSAASYFFSYDNDVASAETGAAIFKSIIQGEGSGVESAAVNMWYSTENQGDTKELKQIASTICSFKHPQFSYSKDGLQASFPVENSSLLNSKELSMMLSLPRKSVPGFPVVENISLAKEVVRHSGKEIKRGLPIGCIFDQGIEHIENLVELDAKSLTQHVFVTGSTGCGKSETVYKLIYEAKHAGAKVLIIEPAKGEYKNVFGKANVFGSNPELTHLLHINPFKFPKGIHVLEHIDRLTEIFNVCWPMYAAMPAVLKKAIIRSYEKAGWNLVKNKNKYGRIFPTFKDLLYELEDVIKDSAYSEEVKGNYVGSLVTRVESLTNGLNGAIFGGEEIPDSVLFDEDTIIDLSRIGSQETKALIMGIIVMRLNEYRMVNATEANVGLKHLTVLEEAHNILKRTSTEQSQEGSNLAGKAVEMITNSIAEIRTYGEGFVIVDQSPTSVDPAAIKNTNTKFIMRLPDGDDRRIAGKSAGLKDSQLDEIAKLPTGVAVTYQNDWEEPVLCKITMRDKSEEVKYSFEPTEDDEIQSEFLSEVVKFLVHGKVSSKVDFDKAKVVEAKSSSMLTTAQKIQLSELIDEFNRTESLGIWSKDRFEEFANLLTDILGIRSSIERIAAESKSFEDLDSRLEAKVIEAIGEVPNPVNIFVRQALLKAYSLGGETRELIYQTWYRGLESKLIQS
ncbi:MAG: DUF87 domain-containing protein [Muribaculaceae bacterium]|nr:DUF87 domain-containing protein [Muribaculaceae bacterium]